MGKPTGHGAGEQIKQYFPNFGAERIFSLKPLLRPSLNQPKIKNPTLRIVDMRFSIFQGRITPVDGLEACVI